MRLFLHTIICCCLFTMVLPLVKGAKEELNSSLTKRLKMWFKSHTKRDLHEESSVGPATDRCSGFCDQPHHQDKNANVPSTPTSIEQNVRFRRSASKGPGCKLGTCVYQNLVDRVLNHNKPKDATPPAKSMGAGGYGRRRRALLEALQLARQTRTQRRSIEAGQQVRRHKSTRTVALRQEKGDEKPRR